jgi:hypothetical protein
MSEKIEPTGGFFFVGAEAVAFAEDIKRCLAEMASVDFQILPAPQRKLSTLEWARENLDPSIGAMPTLIPTPPFDVFVNKTMAAARETLDNMPEKIEPALSKMQWAELIDDIADGSPARMYLFERLEDAGAVALGNFLLPDSDSRKITREKIDLLRMARIEESEGLDDLEATAALQAFADALESYLPPEK